MKQIHIVGTGPRTGTTLLAEAMSTCFNIDLSTEHEDNLFFRPTTHADILLTKHPADLFVIWPSLIVDPELYIICLIRDPRDSVVSRHNKNKSVYWSTLRYWQYFYPKLKKYQKHPRFIPVIYEDFVKNPDEVQRQIEAKIPCLKTTHLFSEYHLHANPSEESKKALKEFRPIDAKGIGNWKQHLPRIKQQIQLHGDITPSLIDLGYEPNDHWLAQLETVEAYQGRSHVEEYFCDEEIKSRTKFKYKEALKRFLASKKIIDRLV